MNLYKCQVNNTQQKKQTESFFSNGTGHHGWGVVGTVPASGPVPTVLMIWVQSMDTSEIVT